MKFLIVLSVIGIVAGFVLASQATMGVAVIGVSCWFMMLARMAQAGNQQAELRKLLGDPGPTPPEVTPPDVDKGRDWGSGKAKVL